MKNAVFALLSLALGLLSSASRAQTLPAATPQRPLRVAFLVYPGVEVLDLAGPMDVFVKAGRLTNNSYRCYTVALADTLLATEAGGLRLRPDYTLANASAPDVLVVPGAAPGPIRQLLANAAALQQLDALSRRAGVTMSVCTGAFVLGGTHALDGRRATTHRLMTDSLARQFPRAQVLRHVRYVRDGRLLTTAGVTAGLDGALALVEEASGRPVAETVARTLEYSRQEGRATPPPSAAPRKMPMRMSMTRPLASKTAPKAGTKPAATPATAAKTNAPLAAAADPVCHMNIKATTPHRHVHRGKTYGFCSESCKTVFSANPAVYVP